MNQKIQELKELLPKSCADILSNKLAILHESVEHMKNLHRLVDHLSERNQFLEHKLITAEKELMIIKNSCNNSVEQISQYQSNQAIQSKQIPSYHYPLRLPSNFNSNMPPIININANNNNSTTTVFPPPSFNSLR